MWSKKNSLSNTVLDLVLQGGNTALSLLIYQPQTRKYFASGERRSSQLSKTGVPKVLSSILLILS